MDKVSPIPIANTKRGDRHSIMSTHDEGMKGPPLFKVEPDVTCGGSIPSPSSLPPADGQVGIFGVADAERSDYDRKMLTNFLLKSPFNQTDEWIANPYLEPATAPLRGPIHPIFAESNFLYPRKRGKSIIGRGGIRLIGRRRSRRNRLDHATMRPILRLASRLLTARPFLSFWHTLFFSPRISMPGNWWAVRPAAAHGCMPSKKIGRCCNTSTSTSTSTTSASSSSSTTLALTPAQESATLRSLTLLAERVSFCLYRRHDSKKGMEAHMRPFGQTSRDEGSETITAKRRCVVAISNWFYRKVIDKAKRRPVLRYDCHLRMAVTLCHEVAHAANYMFGLPSCRIDDMEPVFEDQKMNECGFAWEQFVFGGSQHDTLDEELDDARHLSLWIDLEGRWGAKVGLDENLENRKMMIQQRPQWEVHWRLQLRDLHKYFTEEFWNETVPRQGAAAFKFPKTCGVLLDSDNIEKVFFKELLPKGCNMDKNGTVWLDSDVPNH